VAEPAKPAFNLSQFGTGAPVNVSFAFGAASSAALSPAVGAPHLAFQFSAGAANVPANAFTAMNLPKVGPPMQSLVLPAQVAFPPMMPMTPQFGAQPQMPAFNAVQDGGPPGFAAADANAAFNVGVKGRTIAKARSKK
jgi:hypothetical protein